MTRASSITLLFLTLLSLARHSKGDMALIYEMCSKTNVPDFCVACLTEDPESSGYDVIHLEEQAVRCTDYATRHLVEYLDMLHGKPTTDPSLMPLIEDCSAPLHFSDDVFGKIKSNIFARNFLDATNDAAYRVGDPINHCYDIFNHRQAPTQGEEFEEIKRLTKTAFEHCNALVQLLISLQDTKI